jgi:tetratricopeptide (TPR) repeat protein
VRLPGSGDARPQREVPPAASAGPVPLPAKDGADPFASIELGAPVQPKARPPAPELSLQDDPAPSVVDDAFMDAPRAPKPPKPPDDGLNFDFVETPPKPPAAKQADADLLDFVDDLPKPPSTPTPTSPQPKAGRRPPPPTLSKEPPPAAAPSASMETAAAHSPLSMDLEAEAGFDSKQAEKERKKKEREERAARDREERARRKAEREPGAVQAKLLPALKGSIASLKEPRNIAKGVVVAGLVAFVVFGIRSRHTPSGLFWMNRIIPSKRLATQAEEKVIENGLARLGQGDFAGSREAVAAGAQLLGVLPDDEEVKAFFVLAASELKLQYGQVGGDWDQAKRVVEKMKGTSHSQSRARAAFALANGDAIKGKQLIASTADSSSADLESIWLYADSLVLSGDPGRAAGVLDNALKTRAGAVKLLLLRGQIASGANKLPEAADFFDKALKQAPDNGGALVELAVVRQKQNDVKGAQELLSKALDTDVRKSLDAAEEGRANMLRGNLAAAAHDAKAAETAYERAIALDPTSATVHEAYGQFRLARREWDKASKQFELAVAGNGPSPWAFAGGATAYLGTSHLLEADKFANAAAAKDANNPHFIYLQGRVAEAIGKGDEAWKKYEAALAKKADSAEALVAEGQMMLTRGEKAKARDKLGLALKTPAAGRSLLEDEAIGDLALALGEKDSAHDLFASALEKDPNDPIAHAGMGRALAAQGNLEGAKKELETAIAQVDTDASMHYEYGSVLRTMGQSDAALEALRKSVKLDSKDSRFRARLGALLVERGQFQEAETQLREAVLIDAHSAEGQFFLARAIAGRPDGNLDEAVNTILKAVDIDPGNAEYSYWLGVIYEKRDQVGDAIEALQKSIDKNPKSADAHEHLGLDFMRENRFGEAVGSFKRAAEIDPKRARIWAEVGDAEQQSGDIDGAIRDFQRALAQDAKLTGVWTKLGVAYKDKDCKGCRTRAEDALKNAVQVDGKDALAHYELGYMYKDDGKRRDAIAEFRRYIDLKPDAGEVATVQDDIYYLQEESRRAP